MNQSPSRSKRWLPIVVLLLAIVATVLLIKSRQPPVKVAHRDMGVLVSIQHVNAEDRPLHIQATGTVQPHQQLRLSPQVSGKVISLHQQLRSGGEIRKGELLLSLDARDYRLTLTKAQNTLSAAQLNLQQVENRAAIANSEWHAINGDMVPPPLAAYKPQQRQAQAAVAAAKADVQQAQLNLDRTKLYAPFNSRILSEQVDLGQNLMPGNEIAILAGSDFAEVIIPIPLAELPWLKIGNATQRGSAATISINTSRQRYQWTGQIVRSLGEVDDRGRMSRVVVKIAQPYTTHPELALQPGMFVDVELEGRTAKQVFAIPRSALRDNSSVWLVDNQQRLQIKAIDIVRKGQQHILVRGLAADDQLITTAISGAANGMKLRIKPSGATL